MFPRFSQADANRGLNSSSRQQTISKTFIGWMGNYISQAHSCYLHFTLCLPCSTLPVALRTGHYAPGGPASARVFDLSTRGRGAFESTESSWGCARGKNVGQIVGEGLIIRGQLSSLCIPSLTSFRPRCVRPVSTLQLLYAASLSKQDPRCPPM